MRRSATGSCVRCRRALDLASARVGGLWYGRAVCAVGDPCPFEAPGDGLDAASDEALINRPRRRYGRQPPKELRRQPA